MLRQIHGILHLSRTNPHLCVPICASESIHTYSQYPGRANGLGQVLKSFRYCNVAFSTYKNGGEPAYLDSLGSSPPCLNGDQNLRKCAHQEQGMSKKEDKKEEKKRDQAHETLEANEGQS
ncbi:hypothetical protein GFM09_28320 [Rhizobium leguminosarum bv. viciae]|uniref:hypothetical protein n=1 Tax=Rhizobium leguminosarum TaxID=384 RepID=UPI001440FBC3|nr:hypothetical protein [Rhizobium leguminosarum]MBY5315310.1 hypothetical protein [Rhizobium leguminosarum]MBY5481634.1 hypothetical protein [Rhizobium leguminosarum]MBY5503014.1 hypothetical protein [Rhizobium leguminosarum]NKK17082.1 hypothetical protein [Rhizobium leguminosarum bv. viciae]NKK39391.1 hypothetical protein [Rhizobium leguminosarum bv. viciae]